MGAFGWARGMAIVLSMMRRFWDGSRKMVCWEGVVFGSLGSAVVGIVSVMVEPGRRVCVPIMKATGEILVFGLGILPGAELGMLVSAKSGLLLNPEAGLRLKACSGMSLSAGIKLLTGRGRSSGRDNSRVADVLVSSSLPRLGALVGMRVIISCWPLLCGSVIMIAPLVVTGFTV